MAPIPPLSADLPPFSALSESLNLSDSQPSNSIEPPPVHEPHLYHLAQTILHNLKYQHLWTALQIHTLSPITGEPLLRPLISGIPPKRAYIHPDEQIAVLKEEHAAKLKAAEEKKEAQQASVEEGAGDDNGTKVSTEKGKKTSGSKSKKTNGANSDSNTKDDVKQESSPTSKLPQNTPFHTPEQEWVLPTHIQESFSLRKFSEVFDSITTLPPKPPRDIEEKDEQEQEQEEEEEESEEDTSTGHIFRGATRQKRILLSTLHDDSTVVYYIIHDGIVKPRQN